MKHRSSLLRLFALVLLVVLGGAAGTAAAAPTVAMRKCSIYACDSAESLRAEGRAAAWGLPFDSIVFVTSEQYPLSAFVQVCRGPRGAKDACLITSGDLGAVELDNEVFARAAKIAPIDVPADIASSASSAEWELVEGFIFTNQILIVTGRNGWSPWHNILNPLTWHWMEFFDTRSNENNQVHTKDRITFQFADGSTAQAEMVGVAAASGHFFRLLPETIRGPDGEPLSDPSPPAAAYPSGPGLDLTTPWANAFFASISPFEWCAFIQSHCEFGAGGYELNCYYRRQNFPCG